jgi:hypothetical protein
MAFAAGVEKYRPPVFLSLEDNGPVVSEPGSYDFPPPRLDDLVGTADSVGRTWNDYQQNGTFGKQVAVDRAGWVHHVWTRGLNRGSTQRHCYYNVWDPNLSQFVMPNEAEPIGRQVDGATKAGFINVAVNQRGFAMVAFHQVPLNGSTAHSAWGLDYNPHWGFFAVGEIPNLAGDPQIIWPHIACDVNGNIHTVHTQNGGSGFSYYARGIPQYDEDSAGVGMSFPSGFQQWELESFITMDVAAAHHSQRVAVAWLWDDTLRFNGQNVFLKISEDGGLNWGERISVTNFAPIDTNCIPRGSTFGNVDSCNQDTLRPWVDCSVIFDQNDNAHVAFSAQAWFYWLQWDDAGHDSVGPWIYNGRQSNIWHWDEVSHEYGLVAERWWGVDGSRLNLGKNQLMCERPSMAVDTTTGYLYCSYQMFDTAEVSTAGYCMSDAYMTVSTDNGRTWAEGINVTNTTPDTLPAAPGRSLSERDISIAEFVSGGTVHMQYTLDLDAGTSIWADTPEGIATNSPVYYQRIPVDAIPTSPLIPPKPFHFDSTGFPMGVTESRASQQPAEFALYQNYPNPFNPSTSIQFDLASESLVSLRVFDVLGREVAALLDHQRLAAGAHLTAFDGSALSSGVYFYRLETPNMHKTCKMVLVK